MGPHMLSKKPKEERAGSEEEGLLSLRDFREGAGPIPAEAMVSTMRRAEVLANAVAARAASEALLTSFFVSVIM